LVFHGPVLRQEVDRGLWGPLGAACTMEWSPWVFAQVSGSAPFGYLTAFRIEPRLYLWSDQKVSLGYLWDWTVGPSYDRTLTGMTLTIGFGGP